MHYDAGLPHQRRSHEAANGTSCCSCSLGTCSASEGPSCCAAGRPCHPPPQCGCTHIQSVAMSAAGAGSANSRGAHPPAEQADTAGSTASTSGQHAGTGHTVAPRGQPAGGASTASTAGQQRPTAASLASTLCNLEDPLGIIEEGDMFYSEGTARAALLAAGCCIQVGANRLQGVARRWVPAA